MKFLKIYDTVKILFSNIHTYIYIYVTFNVKYFKIKEVTRDILLIVLLVFTQLPTDWNTVIDN